MPSRCSPRLAEAEHLVEIVSCGDIGGDVVAAGQVVHHQRLAEAARTAEEQETAHLLEFRYPSGLVHIIIVLPSDAAEVGDTHRQ